MPRDRASVARVALAGIEGTRQGFLGEIEFGTARDRAGAYHPDWCYSSAGACGAGLFSPSVPRLQDSFPLHTSFAPLFSTTMTALDM